MFKRITGRALQRIRAHQFRHSPLCTRCLSKDPPRVTLATESDHRDPLYKGGEEHETNRDSLCAQCHKDKTREDMGLEPKREVSINGWDDA